MMRFHSPHARWAACAALFALALGPAYLRAADDPKKETAAEKIRKVLDQVKDLEIDDQPLDEAVNKLREMTGLNFVIDKPNVPPTGMAAVNGLGPVGPSYAGQSIRIVSRGVPLRAGLHKALRQNNLAFVVVGDEILITTPEKAGERVMLQAVSVNVEGVPLKDALKRLARETGANVVLDPKTDKENAAPVTLRLDDVPLETAVELLADGAGLKAVRRNNVLFVTTEAKADKIRKETPPAPAPAPMPPWPGIGFTGIGGIAGNLGLGGGAIGLGGGLGGIGGIGGFGGALGFGGGMAGVTGIAPPVPLTPPLPTGDKPKDKAKDRSKEKLPAPAPLPPSVSPPGDGAPAAAKDRPRQPANRPRTLAPRRRRVG
jgi:hypothetical protein